MSDNVPDNVKSIFVALLSEQLINSLDKELQRLPIPMNELEIAAVGVAALARACAIMERAIPTKDGKTSNQLRESIQTLHEVWDKKPPMTNEDIRKKLMAEIINRMLRS